MSAPAEDITAVLDAVIKRLHEQQLLAEIVLIAL